ncbi:ATP-binding cassette subfamily F protein 3 [Sphaerotilus sulfidivorans]|uniref:Probable ATP-binding protein YheS n=1 Tax=Sphaerotilus sulfidivorans TaxID=639200 RepID=A0A5C1PZV4_9BURK|nr:ATP-binding cassette domain-containing protein [Sphaerotilus sulfidivorans]NZD45349.1 ATP-binding cassette domain-containing protein [Sphaerotilus sulfidivorans]QEN00738.1 ATP-binding cassette domain-containing protein [Sphaerotilus sulfidivorans]
MLQFKNITLRRGTKLVLDDTSFTLQPGEKASLVGRNGAGKSSLFALLTDRLHPDAGDIEMPPRWRIAEVAQNMPETETGATEFVLEGDAPLMAARTALAQAEASGDGHAIGEAHARLAEAGAFDARSRAQALLLGLGFRVSQLDLPVNSFSGGWRMRLQLARALMCPGDLLLLDEPTNHLDLDALVWLEAWLLRFEGTMLVISHDREFLDTVTRVTLHLDEARVTRYGGNYTTFESMRAERMLQQQAAYSRQQEKVAQLQRFIDRFKAKATKAKQAQSRVKALARMEKLAPVLTAADFEFSFREPLSLPNPMLVMDAVEVGYGETAIVRGVTKSVLPGQRIGILGANGQGKSTLVKTLAGALPRLSGRVQEGKGLAIGYFAQQEMDVLRPEEGPLAHMIRLAREVSPQAREQELRDFLGRFRFVGDMVNQEVGSLSGGEKARLVLAMLVWQRPNLLLLDEPTNHLDLTTREALSMALNEYEGTVMLVSHDRALLREVCDEFWLVTGGQVEPFDGDLDDYQKWLLEQSREIARRAREEDRAAQEQARAASQPAAAVPAAPSSRDERKAQAAARMKLAELTRPLKKRQQQAEQALEKAQAEHAALLEAMARPDLSPAERADQGRRLKELADRIETLEMEWLEIGEQIEAMEAA